MEVINLRIEVERKENEPFERLFRRFNRKIQESGILTSAKERKFFSKDPNRRLRREGAVRRQTNRKARYLEFRKRGFFR